MSTAIVCITYYLLLITCKHIVCITSYLLLDFNSFVLLITYYLLLMYNIKKPHLKYIK